MNWKYTDNAFTMRDWFKELDSRKIIACDFEVCSLFTDEQKLEAAKKLEDSLSFNDSLYYRMVCSSNGLSYPALTRITHLSVAWSKEDAYVFIGQSDNLRKLFLNWLVDTEVFQLWHNACFDLKHIYYHTHKFPKHYLDTQLLAKCYLNDAENNLCDTSLKYLMKDDFGDWAVAKDDFNIKNLYDEQMLEYSATDACATYLLFQQMCRQHKEILDYLKNIW